MGCHLAIQLKGWYALKKKPAVVGRLFREYTPHYESSCGCCDIEAYTEYELRDEDGVCLSSSEDKKVFVALAQPGPSVVAKARRAVSEKAVECRALYQKYRALLGDDKETKKILESLPV